MAEEGILSAHLWACILITPPPSRLPRRCTGFYMHCALRRIDTLTVLDWKGAELKHNDGDPSNKGHLVQRQWSGVNCTEALCLLIRHGREASQLARLSRRRWEMIAAVLCKHWGWSNGSQHWVKSTSETWWVFIEDRWHPPRPVHCQHLLRWQSYCASGLTVLLIVKSFIDIPELEKLCKLFQGWSIGFLGGQFCKYSRGQGR